MLALAAVLEAGFLALLALGDLETRAVEFVALYLALFPFYLVSVWIITRPGPSTPDSGRTFRWIWIAAIVFRATLVLSSPQLSEDPIRYRWQGMLNNAGGNPYVSVPEDPRWAGLRDETWPDVTRKDLPSVYGPLYEATYAGWQRIAEFAWPGDGYRQAWSYKLPFAAFELLAAWALVQLLEAYGFARERVLIWLWSPLVLVEFWAQGHNDPLTVFLVVAAFAAAKRERWRWAFAALTSAALAKFWPAMLFPFLLLERADGRWTLRWRPALVALPIAALVCLPYLAGIGAVQEMLEGFVGGWRNNDSLYGWIYEWADKDFDRGTAIVMRLLLGGLAAIWALQLERSKAALAAITLLLLLSANCFPWYLSWFLPFLALYPAAGLLLWTALVALAYNILIPYGALGEWLPLDGFRALEYAPVYALLAAGLAGSALKLAAARRSKRLRQPTSGAA